MLDEALAVAAGPVIASRGAAAVAHQPANPFLFFKLPTIAGARGAFPRAAAAMSEGRVVPAKVEARRRARTLTAPQQRALDLLLDVGANLSPDFTAHELRGEYRVLARRVHPDCHPIANSFERARLSRRFADIADCYRCLLAAAEVSH